MSICRIVQHFTLAALLSSGALVAAATPPACGEPASRAFDFWIGDWNVHTPDGKLAGQNRITREYGGCVIHEHYSTARGYSGESLNIYDRARGVWHQTWVDNGGLLLLLDGGMHDGAMVLEGQTLDHAGKPVKQRITWTPHADGSVRQLWETRAEGGEWAVAFDGTYRKR